MSQQTILTPQTLDLIRVSTEFCKYIEQCATAEKQEFCRVMLGLLPLLYLKTHLIPDYHAFIFPLNAYYFINMLLYPLPICYQPFVVTQNLQN